MTAFPEAGPAGSALDQGCAALSLDAGEPLAGTAPSVRRLVALEHVGAWPPRVAAHPDPDVAGLAARLWAQDALLVLIRRPTRRRRRAHPDRTVFTADLTPGAGRVTQTRIRGPEDLRRITFDPDAGRPVTEPLLLVCAHGRRDVCCAVRGHALATALDTSDPAHRGTVWECTHLGGHRFAPTGLVLPTGYAYGRLDPRTAAVAHAAAGRGEVEPDRCRGHVGLSPAEQAAELAVRSHVGVTRAGALTVEPVDGPGDVVVRGRDGRAWAVPVWADSGVGARPASCGAAPEPALPLVAGPPRALV